MSQTLLTRTRRTDPYAGVPLLALSMLLMAILMGVALIWAGTTQVSEVAFARGVLQPADRIAIVSHPTGGRILARHAQEGAFVTAGTPLVTLDTQAVAAELATVQARLAIETRRRDNARLIMARLTTRALSAQPGDPAAVAAALEDIAAKRLAVDSAKADVRRLRAALGAAKENLTIAADLEARQQGLAERGHSSEYALLKARAQLAQARGSVATLTADVARAGTQVNISERRYDQVIAGESERQARIGHDAGREITALSARAALLQDAIDRHVVTALIDGHVQDILNHKAGHLLAPGGQVARIVPSRGSLVAEVAITPGDMPFVSAGQKARLYFDGVGREKFRTIAATVQTISPTSHLQNTGAPAFRALLALNEEDQDRFEAQFPLIAGMALEARVETGRKSILAYLLKPLLALTDKAMGER